MNPLPSLSELQQVEEPFLRQLQSLGWQVIRGDKYEPSVTLRESFQEVILESELKAFLHSNYAWLQDDQVAQLIRRLQSPQSQGLLKVNQEMLELLLAGHVVSENRVTAERSPSVHFLDFDYSANNRFLAVSQFKVNVPGTDKHIIPDIVLFINGIPIAVIECKAPDVVDPKSEAIVQLLRYQNRRPTEENEGNPRLFWYNQMVVATFRQKCFYSTITGESEHFVEWKDPYPFKLSDIQVEPGAIATSQHIFIQGVFSPVNLLDIIHNFTIFKIDDRGNLIKAVARYQQFRTVRKIIARLRSQDAPAQKGGIVWHTQGSGKSMTMMFAIRAMYHTTGLTNYKIVLLTDRTDLQTQLTAEVASAGYTLQVASSIAELKDQLRSTSPNLVMGMIHKFQEKELEQQFPLLNNSVNILVMIDEAHRSQYKYLGANLQVALPNAVRLAFTGTPIEKTELTFGDYIDRYSIRQAVEDGVTVEIVYEGRTQKSAVTFPDEVNRCFADVFEMTDQANQQLIMDKYTWRAFMEAEENIKVKARDMFEHYLAQVFPNRFKAQVVAVSRLAAIRYKMAFDDLIREYIARYESDPLKAEDLAILRTFKAEVVISGAANDDPIYQPYTKNETHESIIARFKLPFDKTDDRGNAGDVGIIVVQSMLITGFDAPVEQVMYLDDKLVEHNLLQAIARVNRVSKNKTCGYVVDYVGIVHHLRKALGIFSDEDNQEIESVFHSVAHDKDSLVQCHASFAQFFSRYQVNDWRHNLDECMLVLADGETRNDFIAQLRAFTSLIDRVLPDPEALKYVDDLNLLTYISESARNMLRDDKLSIRDASRKIREIVDEYLIANGVDPRIPPIPILDERFNTHRVSVDNPEVRSREVESAVREYINVHREEDPELFERLSEKLQRIIDQNKANWDLLVQELEAFVNEIRNGRQAENTYGFKPDSELPFMALISTEVYGEFQPGALSEVDLEKLTGVTQDIIEAIRRQIGIVDFWNNLTAQKRLKAFILSQLITTYNRNPDFMAKQNAVVQRIMELAMHLHPRLLS